MFFQPVQHNVVVIAGFEIVKDMFDFAISVNQEADAMNTIVGFAHEGLFHPRRRIVRTPGGPSSDRSVKLSSSFSAKRESFFGFIGADTQHINARFFQLIHVIA